VNSEIYKELATNFANRLASKFGDKIKLILLGGSAGRNEAAVLKIKERIILLSDLDIYIFVEYNPRKFQEIFEKEAEIFVGSHNFDFVSSPFFHISIATLTPKSLKSSWKHIRFYEMLASAKPIYGDDIREKINLPKELDPVFTHRLLIERAMQQILFEKHFQNAGKHIKVYFISRNLAELATILHYSNKRFITSYRERAKKLPELCEEVNSVAPGYNWYMIFNTIKLATKIKTCPSPEIIFNMNISNLKEHFKYSYSGVFTYLRKKYKEDIFEYSLKSIKFLPTRHIMISLALFLRKPKYYFPGILTYNFKQLLNSPQDQDVDYKLIKPFYFRTRHRELKEGEMV